MFKGLGNLTTLIKQAQQMGTRLQAIQEDLKKQRAVGRAGADLVVVVNDQPTGKRASYLDQGLVQRGDREMLEDLIPAAVNQALAKSKEMHRDAMKELTGGMSMPPFDDLIAMADQGAPSEGGYQVVCDPTTPGASIHCVEYGEF